MQGKTTYRSEVVFCGKPNCRRCRQGIGHGPYWYAYHKEGGRLRKTYIGLHLPEGVTAPTQTIGRVNQSTLVGREHEQALLQSWLLALERPGDQREQQDKERSAVPGGALLLGEAGIGKTRLAEEVARKAAERGWAVAWSHAYPQESTIPYRIWIEVLRKATAQNNRLRREIARRPLIYQSLGTLLPELQDLLSQDALPPAALPEQEQLRLWEAIRALLSTLAGYGPLLIVLDDLQWADSSSCELLAYLVRQLRGQPVMIVGTCREIELPANHPLRPVLVDLRREQAMETLTIGRLTDEQIRALVSHMPEPVVRYIQTSAAGNPFFAEELARGVEASHFAPSQPAAPGAATTHETAGAPGDLHLPTTLPDTISAVLDLRLGRLSLACQRLLVRAAVLGGSFEINTILAMEAGGPDADEDIILDLLDEALQAGMLTEEGSGTHITYYFWHPLLVSHLYDGLSAGRRASLHRRAAEVLREIYQGREQEGAAAIVHHLANGGAESPQIAYYAELAGDRAYALSAYPEAERHYQLAVQHIGPLPADASPDESLRLANLLERLGECSRVQGKAQEARDCYEQALAVRSRQSLPAPEYEAQIDALLWIELGKTWFDTGDYEQARVCYRRGEALLRQAGITTGSAWASLYIEQSYILWQEGNSEEAQSRAQQALTLFDAALGQQEAVSPHSYLTATRRTLAGDSANLGRTHTLLAAIAVTVGQHPLALKHLNTALSIFERHDRRREIAIVCGNLGDLYLRQAEHALAQAALERALSIAQQIGSTSVAVIFGNLGVLARRRGRLAEAEAYYKRGLVLAEQVNDPVYISLLYSYLATAAQDQGKLDEARLSLHQALKVSRAMNILPCIGFALVALGRLHIAQAQASQENESGEPATVKQQSDASSTRLLKLARTALQRALALEGLEAETRTEGQLALAQASFLLGEIDTARRQAMQAMEEARRLEQTWLLACAQRLMGEVLSAQGQQEEAGTYFGQALETLQKCGMRLEWARTLQSYGVALLQRNSAESTSYQQQGLSYLQEAYQAFRECNAMLDLQAVSRVLSLYSSSAPPIASSDTQAW